MDNQTLGANIDIRSDEEKAKDFRFDEIVSTPASVVWTEKPQNEWRKFQIYNQDGSGSCVAQTARKLLGILHWLKTGKWIDHSASHIYQRRSNRPQGGMGGDNVFQIMKDGTTLEENAESDLLNDEQMDSIDVSSAEAEAGKIYSIKNYLTITPKDIEAVASIIQTTGKGVMVWFYWKYDEWLDVPIVKYPGLDLRASDTSRHSVCAVDFTLYNGEKALVIDESWDKTATALDGQRIITESFYKQRNWYAAYPMNFKYEETKHVFKKTLRFSKVFFVDPEVKELQNVLKKEGLFPTNVDSTGYFGAITLKSVKAFQTKHGLLADGIVGPKTNNVLNSL